MRQWAILMKLDVILKQLIKLCCNDNSMYYEWILRNHCEVNPNVNPVLAGFWK